MLDWNGRDNYQHLIDILQNDGVVLASSDTVLGLFAQLSEKSKKRLDAVKKRNVKPYIVLIKSAHQLHNFIDQPIDDAMQKIIDQCWPGPLTIILKAKSTLPDWLVSSQKTIAIRIPDHQGLQKLLQHFDGLFTTSANISDQPLPDRYSDVNPELLQQVQAVCCQVDKIYDGPASTIVDFSSGSIKILRLGAVVIDSI